MQSIFPCFELENFFGSMDYGLPPKIFMRFKLTIYCDCELAAMLHLTIMLQSHLVLSDFEML